jgi:hypothetical protein
MGRFIPNRNPRLWWSWIAGTGHSVENPGGVAGNVLTTSDITARFAVTESICDTYGIANAAFIMPQGIPVGATFSAATFGLLQTFYPDAAAWFTQIFPSKKSPRRRYCIYTGSFVKQSDPNNQNAYLASGDTLVRPSAAFMREAVRPFMEAGFKDLWLDATDGAPGGDGATVNDDAVSAGWNVGGEALPNDGIVYPINQLEVRTSELTKRPYMMLWSFWKSAYRSRFASKKFDPNTEVHICPLFGDTDFTTSIVDELLAQNAIISPYQGFELTSPSVFAYIFERQKVKGTARSRLRSR